MGRRGGGRPRSPEAAAARRAGRGPGLIDVGINCSTFVRAPRERVYDAFATAEGLDGWFTTGTTMEPRPGGGMVWRWRDWGPDRVTTEAVARILEVRRPERFSFAWDSGDTDPTTVEMTFEEAEGGTIVRLREHGYHDTPRGLRAMLDCAAGWGEALTLAKFYVEHGLLY
jgi:uncharacterized protein YndB with AHSA1/START domain